jgi:hypothetical protein
MDIDLRVARAFGPGDTVGAVRAVREMLQATAGVPLQDWFEYTVGSPITDVTAASLWRCAFSH